MTFNYVLSDRLKDTLRILSKRNRQLALEANKKIRQILLCDDNTINHYKNLRHDLSEYKRAHVGKSFVLIFKVFHREKIILFDRLEHHDDAYRR